MANVEKTMRRLSGACGDDCVVGRMDVVRWPPRYINTNGYQITVNG